MRANRRIGNRLTGIIAVRLSAGLAGNHAVETNGDMADNWDDANRWDGDARDDCRCCRCARTRTRDWARAQGPELLVAATCRAGDRGTDRGLVLTRTSRRKIIWGGGTPGWRGAIVNWVPPRPASYGHFDSWLDRRH